ncbi:MAG: hypothetical protein ACW99U_15430 [Candidatus Thorarchaeota archaeon]
MTDERSDALSRKGEETKLSGHSMSMIRICPKCDSDMEPGVLGGRPSQTLSWYGRDKGAPVTTHRCPNCGYIEQWATKPKTDFLGAIIDEGRLKCPHCGAVYVYPDTAVYVSKDKPLIDCMNCRKPILVMN